MKRLACALLGVLVAVACGSSPSSTFADPNAAKQNGIDDGGSSGSFPIADSALPPPPKPATDVQAVVTSDNAFSFGYGDGTSIATFIRGEGSDGDAIFNCPVGFGPTAYLVPAAQAPTGAYLYIVAWADEQVTQGTLAQFKRVGADAVYSGDAKWEVCAVGTPFQSNGTGPDQGTIGAGIASCNMAAAGATYSKGWVSTAGAITPGALGKLAIGKANDDAGGLFPIVCQKDDAGTQGIDAVAKWMWFDPQDNSSPFSGNAGNRTKTYLIFRLPADALPPAPVK